MRPVFVDTSFPSPERFWNASLAEAGFGRSVSKGIPTSTHTPLLAYPRPPHDSSHLQTSSHDTTEDMQARDRKRLQSTQYDQ